MKRALLILLLAGTANAEITRRYLLHDFNNGKAVGKNVFDAGPLSDRDEQEFSKTRVQVGGVPDGADGQGIKVRISLPPNPALGYEYGGIYFSQDRFDASAFNMLHFQMRLPEGLGFLFPLKVSVTDDDPIYGKTDYSALLWFHLKSGSEWQDVQIPFDRLLDRRFNSLRGRRITAVAFSADKAGVYEFHLDNLEFASAANGLISEAALILRPQTKLIAGVMDEQDFAKGMTHEAYLNIQESPRFGYVEGRISLAVGEQNGQFGLANFSELSETSRTSLRPAFFMYPRGETGLSLIFDGWGKNWLGLKSVTLGNNLIHYSDATYFQSWFPAWTAPAHSTLPLLGSARIQGTAYDAFAALADYQGTDATTFGLKAELWGLQLIGSSASLSSRTLKAGNPSEPIYNDSELTLQYAWGRLKDPIRFNLWGGLFQSTDYYLTSDTGQKFFDVNDKRVILNQRLLSPTAKNDRGISAKLYLSDFFLKGNQIALNAAWIGPNLKPLYRDYYEGGVDDLYYDTAGGGISLSQAIWQLQVSGGLSESTAPSNLFKRRSQQNAGISWHDIFGIGLDIAFSQIWLQELNNYNDQVNTFWDQRDRVSQEIKAGFKLGPWAEIQAKHRKDDDQLWSNYSYGTPVKEDAGFTAATKTLVEAKINVWSQTRLFVTYSKETPFGYYTYYDPQLIENYSGLRLESTF